MNEEEYHKEGKWWVLVPVLTVLIFFLSISGIVISIIKKVACG